MSASPASKGTTQRQREAMKEADAGMEPESRTLEAQKIYAEIRRKEAKALKKAEDNKQRIYRTLMRKAGIKSRKKHLDHIKDSTASDRMPKGAVSDHIYQDLIKARQFDRYHRPHSERLTKEEEQQTQLQDTMGALAAALSPDKNATKKPLVTPKWVIGYKKEEHGPPGLAPPRNGVLNSEGNEHYYSYDGLWQDGKMHGGGRYKFADGHLHVGVYKDGKAHGEGTAQYPGGTLYRGHWRFGKLDGEGKCTYETGSIYDGQWKEGKRHGEGLLTMPSGVTYSGDFYRGKYHGRGELTLPTTGYSFIGTFRAGRINGPGALVYPDGSRDTREWSKEGGMTMKEVVEHALQEKARDAERKTRDRDAAFAIRLAVKLNTYVESVKEAIALKREEVALEKERLHREEVNEKKKRQAEMHEKALQMLAKSADDEAEDIVATTKDATEEI